MTSTKIMRGICLAMLMPLTAMLILGFAQLAMGQRATEDELKIRISTGGICHFLDTSIPCVGLGDRLKSMKLEKRGLQLEIDDGVKQEAMEAAYKSLWRAGFKKVGYVSNEIFR